jgi:hypothetical protein
VGVAGDEVDHVVLEMCKRKGRVVQALALAHFTQLFDDDDEPFIVLKTKFI